MVILSAYLIKKKRQQLHEHGSKRTSGQLMNRRPFEDDWQRLRQCGWTFGEIRRDSRWLVAGSDGQNLIQVSATAQSTAWRLAIAQAESICKIPGA
jgi:hypothetical protein